MKNTCLLIFLSFIINVNAQDHKYNCIYGVYQDALFGTFYIIDDDFTITKFSFCNKEQSAVCDYFLIVDKAKYKFENDTLSFNFGLIDGAKNDFTFKWVYVDSCRFVDFEMGEYFKVDEREFDKILNPLKMKLID